MENKKTFSNFKLLLETKNIEEKVQEPEPDQIIFINRIEKLIKEKDKR